MEDGSELVVVRGGWSPRRVRSPASRAGRSGSDRPAKGIPYVVFPGNIGDGTPPTVVIQKLQGSVE